MVRRKDNRDNKEGLSPQADGFFTCYRSGFNGYRSLFTCLLGGLIFSGRKKYRKVNRAVFPRKFKNFFLFRFLFPAGNPGFLRPKRKADLFRAQPSVAPSIPANSSFRPNACTILAKSSFAAAGSDIQNKVVISDLSSFLLIVFFLFYQKMDASGIGISSQCN